MRRSATLAFLTLAAAPALGDEPCRRPPEAAYAACASASAGAACTVAPPDRPAIAGQCVADPEQRVFCRPDRPPPGERHRPHGPPPAALAACRDHTDGAACSVTTPDGIARAGLCGRGPEGALACRPEPPAEAFAACAGMAQAAACTVTPPRAGARAIDGRCEAWADQRTFCRPDRPQGGGGPRRGDGGPRCAGGPHGPPPEAFAACGGRADGDACAVTPPDRPALSGQCRAGPQGRLACRPDGPPPRDEGR